VTQPMSVQPLVSGDDVCGHWHYFGGSIPASTNARWPRDLCQASGAVRSKPAAETAFLTNFITC